MRLIHDIPGGVHPPEQKFLSNQQPIRTAPLFAQYVVPLQQTIGVAATPIVSVGDRVLTGQTIGTPTGFFSAAIHAPTSGVVTAIESRPAAHPSGMWDTAICIEADGQDEWYANKPVVNWRDAGHRDLIEHLRESGISGLGGASFPTAAKLDGQRPITTLIINGTECEPYITADDLLMRERAEEIRTGVEIIHQILGKPAEVIIGIEDNKPEALGIMRQAFIGTGFEVVSFPTKYPSGGEKQLIQILTGKEVPTGDIPSALGIVVQNVGTAAAVKQAVVDGQPLISRITTITGEQLEDTGNFEVRIGTRIVDLLGYTNNSIESRDVIMGGPMMGFEIKHLDAPIVKASNCLLLVEQHQQPVPVECIRCGLCAEACPASLLPQQLYWYAKADDHEKLDSYNLKDCIECGACAYVCPSNLPLVQHYRAAKGRVKVANEAKQRSDRARERFEFRKQRMEAAEAEREAKRIARKAAAEKAKRQKAEAPTVAPASNQHAQPKAKLDPLAAAKAKLATTKQKESISDASRLAKQIKSTEKRIEFILEQIDDAKKESSEQLIPQLESKLATARLKLSQLQSKETTPSEPNTTTDRAVKAVTAIADAKLAKPQSQRNDETIARIEANLEKTQHLLAKTDDEDARTKLNDRINKLKDKLAEAKQAPLVSDEAINDGKDKALEAIERAKQATAQFATLTDDEKRLKKLEQAKTRLIKARERLAQAQEDNHEHVDAFHAAVEKLESTVASLENPDD